MKSNRYKVLHEIVRIANRTAADHPLLFKEILRFLVQKLPLSEATLLLFSSRATHPALILHSSGTELFSSCQVNTCGLPERKHFSGNAPLSWGGVLYFPLVTRQAPMGFLTVTTASGKPPAGDLMEVLGEVCEELAGLAQTSLLVREESWRMADLWLLSELRRELIQATSSEDLLQRAGRTLLQQGGIACVIFRTLHGGTVAGGPQVIGAEERPAVQVLALEKEQQLALLSMSRRAAVIRLLKRSLPDQSTDTGLRMLTHPLLFQDEILGAVSLVLPTPGPPGEQPFDGERQKFLGGICAQIAHALARISALERLSLVSEENARQLREMSTLFRISRMLHSTLRMNEIIHFILSAAAATHGGGFERAMLFMVNERTGALQGMLGLTRETADLVFSPDAGSAAWEFPRGIHKDIQQTQRQTAFCRQVMKQRLRLSAEDNPLARSAIRGRVIFVPRPDQEPPAGQALAQALQLGGYACAPLMGRDHPLGVLVVDNPESKTEIVSASLRFLELFASQAGAAMENALLLTRLETTNQELRDAQEKMIQGEKMALLGEMAAGVAHELKNPLVSIGGFAQRLARGVAGAQAQEYSAIILREARRLEDLLGGVLAFSKKQFLCFTQCDLAAIIAETLVLEGEVLARAAVAPECDIAPDCPRVSGDERKLKQVLLNLIENARQAMPQGGVLAIRAFPALLKGKKAIEVEVENTGEEIPAEVLRQIFNPFFSTKEEGTGLGLAISARIIEQHRGEIQALNRDGKVVFRFILPAV